MSVASILQQMAENSGRAKLQRGQLLGDTIAGLSQMPGQILADRDRSAAMAYQQQRLQAQDQRVANQDARQARGDAMEEQAAQAATQRTAALQKAIATGFGDSTNPKDFDVQKAAASVIADGYPDAVTTLSDIHRKFVPEAKPAEPFTLGKGEQRFAGTGGAPIASGPVDVPKVVEPKKYPVTVAGPNGQPMTKLVTEAEMQAGVATYREPKAAKEERLVQIAGPNGTPIWVREPDAVGKPAAQAPRAVTGAERQSMAFYNRAQTALDALTEGGDQSLEEKMAKQGLAGQAQLQYGSNLVQTGEQQQYRQAQRAFTEARLRKESGAAINDKEYDKDARTYFAQPGDSAAVKVQKSTARAAVLAGLKFSAGKAYEEFTGEPNLSPARQAMDTKLAPPPGPAAVPQVPVVPAARTPPSANPFRKKA